MSGKDRKKTYQVKAVAFLAIILGVAIQIQASILAHGDYKGIRINLADLVLPLAGLIILASLLLKHSKWPKWSVPLCYGFLAILTGIMTYALINGYIVNDEWMTWALINKFAGWFILLAYFAMGGWLATNYNEETLPVFLKSFIYFTLGIVLIYTLKDYINHLVTHDDRILYRSQVQGLTGNRNAFVFVFFTSLALASLIKIKGHFFIRPAIIITLWGFSPLFLLYNGSRAGFVITLLLLLYLTATNFRFFISRMIPSILLCSLIIAATIGTDAKERVIEQHQKRGASLVKLAQEDFSDPADLQEKFSHRTSEFMRFRVFHDAIELWKTSPVMGTGLGTFLHSQYEKYDPETTIIDIIDSTPLWLLTETGIIGLFCFLAFYIMALYSLWRYRRKNPDTLHGQFAGAVIIIMIGFGLMSLLHELLYTRFFWLFIGMALGLPRLQKQ